MSAFGGSPLLMWEIFDEGDFSWGISLFGNAIFMSIAQMAKIRRRYLCLWKDKLICTKTRQSYGKVYLSSSFSCQWEYWSRMPERLVTEFYSVECRSSEGTLGMSALSGRKGARIMRQNTKAMGLPGRTGLAGCRTTKASAALGNLWLRTRRGPVTIDLCIGKIRVRFLPLPRGTWGSCPTSQEGSLANEQYAVLGEDAFCPSRPSCASKQKGIHGTRRRIQVYWGMLLEYGRNVLKLG